MKVNETGKYLVTEGEMYIQDVETKERLIFLLDKKNMLVIRSMLEDDIKSFVDRSNSTSKEKRERKRMLYQTLPQKDSELYFFVIEKIIGKSSKNKWNGVYELDRVPIGIACRAENENNIGVFRKPNEGIEALIYDGEENNAENVLKMVKQLGNHFGIQGTAYLCP